MSHAGQSFSLPEKRPACDATSIRATHERPVAMEAEVTHIASSALFDALEIAVIALGKNDPVFMNMGPWSRTIARLFGITAPNALAAPRLEALRLLVIALRRQNRDPRVEVAAALGSGFSQDQIDRLSAEMAAVALTSTALVTVDLERVAACSPTCRGPEPTRRENCVASDHWNDVNGVPGAAKLARCREPTNRD